MSERKRLTWRLIWLQAHKWLGIALFAAFAVLGVTGSMLVYDQATERTIYPARFPERPAIAELQVSIYADAAQAVLPSGDMITALRLPIHPGEAVLAGGTAMDRERLGPPARYRVWLNPVDAQPIAAEDARDDLMWFAHALHGHLMAPTFGRDLVGWLGWAMLISSISGIYLWWPRNGRLVLGLRWRRTPSLLGNLHYYAGFWLAIPLAVLSLTGAYIAFPAPFQATFNFLAGERVETSGARDEEAPPSARRLAQPRLHVDQAVALAVNAHGGGRPNLVIWPLENAPTWRVTVCCANGAIGPAILLIDDTTGAATLAPHVVNPSDAGAHIGAVLQRIHAGEGLGPIWRALVFLVGVAPALLGISGVIMWLRGRSWRRQMRGETKFRKSVALPAERN